MIRDRPLFTALNLFIFIPAEALRSLFKTGPMDGATWGRVVIAIVLPFIVIELWKVISPSKR